MIIEIPLIGEEGFELRKRSANYLDRYAITTGAERGSLSQQGSGLLAEIVVRHYLKFPKVEDDPDRHTNLGYDILLPNGVKIDVKCRGGKMPFIEAYDGKGTLKREAKHNFFARQIYDDKLDTDIYLMTHLLVAGEGELPGTIRQRKWCLYVCGWVSKDRVKREGVYLERGSITERAESWFAYRDPEVEFYQRNLNGLNNIQDILNITNEMVNKDSLRDVQKLFFS
jgi:hypothetical protein